MGSDLQGDGTCSNLTFSLLFHQPTFIEEEIATNTDSTKNVGNSILYETVLAVLKMEADTGLQLMAINILGNSCPIVIITFGTPRLDLLHPSTHHCVSYVALNTLLTIDTSAVQRLDYLRHGGISIRRRAPELSYALIGKGNVRMLMRELLVFLKVADDEFKLRMTTQIRLAAERFAPNKK